METLFIALLSAYGPVGLLTGAAAGAVWFYISKLYWPEKLRQREREEKRDDRIATLVEANTAVSADLRLGIGELRASIGELRQDFKNTQYLALRLAEDVDDVKQTVSELKGAFAARRGS